MVSLTLKEKYRRRRIFGPKGDEVMGGWGRLHKKESSNIIRVIKSRRMRWAGHAASMRVMRNTKLWSGNMKGRNHSEDLDTDGRIKLEWSLQEIGCEDVDRINLAQERGQWRDLLSTVMNLWVS
jgi:hypothetical protein